MTTMLKLIAFLLVLVACVASKPSSDALVRVRTSLPVIEDKAYYSQVNHFV